MVTAVVVPQAQAVAVSGQCTWASTLQGRVLDGNTANGYEAYYDTALNITWLDLPQTTMTWNAAQTWASNLKVNGVGDYDVSGNDQSDHGLSNTGPFKNVLSQYYWSGVEYAPDTNSAWIFNTSGGFQPAQYKYRALVAWAVRPGDVAAVPEPQTYALMALGLAGLAVVSKRRQA